MGKEIDLYLDYAKKTGQRDKLYQTVKNNYNIESAMYPGSHIDISPSLYIPKVTYVDSFKGTIKFFSKLDVLEEYINANKAYDQLIILKFIGSDYYADLEIEAVDLVISQYAGFVSQASKKYIKYGGILLANDSHGDATIAYLDKDFEFIGVVNSNQVIKCDSLFEYFKFARPRVIDKEKVLKTMKGPNYKVKAANYLFKYIGHPLKIK